MTLRVLVSLSDGLRFPSVKAQELMMALADCGDLLGTRPDLFDPNLDESYRCFEYSLQTPLAREALEEKVRQILGQDPEVAGFSVEHPAGEKVAPQEPTTAPRQLRVDSRRLDELNRLAGELVVLKEQVSSVASRLGRFSQSRELQDLSKQLRRSVHGLHEVSGGIQDRARQFQQVPLGSLLQRFQRIARDTSRKLGKKIECAIEGAETEVDGHLLDRLGDLLVHLVRNASDHGIESPEERRRQGKPEEGRISISAYQEEDYVVIEVADDGGGIDVRRVGEKAAQAGILDREALARMSETDVLRLIFRSGFSTSEAVSEVSGRGVGLDVVKARVEEMNGLLDFRTELGRGTTFVIRLPCALSIVQALLVESEGELFAIPLPSVLRVLRLGSKNSTEEGMRVLRLEEVLAGRAGGFRQERSEEGRYLVELGYGVERYGLVVDQVQGRKEIVIRPLGRVPGRVAGVGGVAVLGDGRIVVVLDPRFLVERGVPKERSIA